MQTWMPFWRLLPVTTMVKGGEAFFMSVITGGGGFTVTAARLDHMRRGGAVRHRHGRHEGPAAV